MDRPLVRYETFVYDSSRWEGFDLRPDDIIISTPPKCGTTWTQMITALLIFQTPDLPARLARLSPWLDMRTRARRDVVADLEAQTHRRFIKTHTPLDGIPLAEGVTYICVGRDPRDVGLSMGDHRTNLDLDVIEAANDAAARIDGIAPPGRPDPPPPDLDQSVEARFWRWVLDDTPATRSSSTLLATLEHVASYWVVRDADYVVLLHYDDLMDDLEGGMRALARRLGITVADERWPALVHAASFGDMRRHADLRAPNSDTGIWRNNVDFFREARRGAWHEVLCTAADRARYDRRAAALVPPDLDTWIHRS